MEYRSPLAHNRSGFERLVLHGASAYTQEWCMQLASVYDVDSDSLSPLSLSLSL